MKLFVLIAMAASGALFSFLLYMAARQYIKASRRREARDWEIGDRVSVLMGMRAVEARLSGWCEDSVYFELDGKIASSGRFWVLCNKSALWRRCYNRCRSYMGRKPAFSPEAVEMARGVDTLTKEECAEYLSRCLENEDYETADLIRKRMERLG